MSFLTSDELLVRLRKSGIEFELYEHASVFTIEAMMTVCGEIPGTHTKNLFLRDGEKTYFLVTLRYNAQVDIKSLRQVLGARGGLSFASLEDLREYLGAESGAVSPLSALNAKLGSIKIFLEAALLEAPRINVHPLVSTRTLSVAPSAIADFLDATGHQITTFALPRSPAEEPAAL